MFNLLKSDLYRLAHGKMLWVALAVTFLILVMGTSLLVYVASPEFAQMVNMAVVIDEANGSDTKLGKAELQETLHSVTHAESATDDEHASSADAASANEPGATDAARSSNAESAASNVASAFGTAPTPSTVDSLSRIDDASDLTSEEVMVLNEKTYPSFTYSVAQMCLTGGGIGLMSCLVTGLFLTSDFSTGFAKSLLSSRRRRLGYYAEKLVLAAIISAVFVAANMAFLGAMLAAAGFTYQQVETVGDVLLWGVLTWAVITVYNFIVAVVSWLSRSKVVAVLTAVFISTTVLGSILLQLMMLLSSALPKLAVLTNLLPSNCISLLGSGSAGLTEPNSSLLVSALTPAGQIAVLCLLFLAACAALALTACKRKDL